MEIRSLGESKGNYTNSSVRQFKQRDTDTHSHATDNTSGNGKLAVGLLAGASVGILAGILLAPERGREMRKQIANSAAKMGNQMNKAMHTYKDRMNTWTGKRVHEAPPSNEELNGPANRSTTTGSGTVDKHVL